MPAIIEYIIKLSLCLGITFLFYRVLLSRLTFYNWNRWYLLGYSLLSFIIPVIDIMPSLQKRNFQEGVFIQWIPSINTALQVPTAAAKSWDVWQIVIVTLITGVLFFTLRFTIRLLSLYRLKKNSTALISSPVKIYQVNEPIRPFSFGTSMYINAQHHTPNELQEIIRHEFVHIKQLHSIDIILVEILCIINWFNPFAWLIKKAVKHNLEFIADRKMLEKCSSKKEYQYLLLKVMGNTQFSFANNFNFISLKKRIAMMNKNKTAQIHLSRFLFLLPVISVSLLSFRSIELRNIVKEDPQTTGVINMLADIEPVKNISEVVIKDEPLLKTIVTDTPRQIKKVVLDGAAVANSSISNNNQQQPLILINGTETNIKTLSAIHPTMIEHVQILKNATAIAKYGEKGKNGVILITTKGENYYDDLITYTLKPDEPEYNHSININNQISSNRSVNFDIEKNYLYVDDGKIDIYIIEKNKKWEVVQSINGTVKPVTEDVIFIFDKKEISIDKAQSLPPEMIKSVRVLKNAETIEKYGYKGKKAIFEFGTQPL